MFKTLRRASIILSLVLLVTMVTSADIVSESGLSTPDNGLAGRGEALLKAIDFSLSDGLAQLTINRTADNAYVIRLDLQETVAKMGEERNYRLMLLMIALWVFFPALWQTLKSSSKPPATPLTRQAENSAVSPGKMARYNHIRGLTLAQTAKLVTGVICLVRISASALRSVVRGDLRVRQYHPRHAIGRRQKTVIVEFRRRGGFAA